jgi:hypothetical protein
MNHWKDATSAIIYVIRRAPITAHEAAWQSGSLNWSRYYKLATLTTGMSLLAANEVEVQSERSKSGTTDRSGLITIASS